MGKEFNYTDLSAGAKVQGSNKFKITYGESTFQFGYWDRVSLRKAKNMISEGKIAHEGVPLEVLHVDQDRDVIIDIGAYFGVYSVILAGLNRSIPVYSFEPDEHNHKILNKNLDLNGFDRDRVQTRQSVVSDESGSVDFFVNRRKKGSVSHTVNPTSKHNDYKKTTINSVSISELCSTEGFQHPWVKIDAEGEEMNILKDIFNSSQIESVKGIVELHISRENITRDRFKSLLESNGHTFEELKTINQETNPGFLIGPKRQV